MSNIRNPKPLLCKTLECNHWSLERSLQERNLVHSLYERELNVFIMLESERKHFLDNPASTHRLMKYFKLMKKLRSVHRTVLEFANGYHKITYHMNSNLQNGY